MLKCTTTILILLISIISKSQTTSNQYILKCKFEGLPNNSSVRLQTQNRDTLQIVNSTEDEVTFTGNMNPEGQFLFIHFDPSVTDKSSNAIFVKNTIISVKGTIGKKEVNVQGSPEHDQYSELLRKEIAQGITINKIMSERNKFTSEIVRDSLGVPIDFQNKVKLDSFIREQNEAIEQLEFMKKSWIEGNPNSLLTPYIMMSMFSKKRIPYLKNEFKNLSSISQKSYYGTKLKKELQFAETYLQVKEGAILPNLTIADTTGKKVSILEIAKNNKLTLIDCWASWCKPCRNEIPKLKEMYNKFHSQGLNIIGISSDKEKSKWIEAIKSDQTPWEHYAELEDQPFTKMLSIESIPSYILIDNTGNIKSFDVGMALIRSFGKSLRGENLEQTIKSSLNEILQQDK